MANGFFNNDKVDGEYYSAADLEEIEDGFDGVEAALAEKASEIGGLSDVDTSTTAPTDGQALVWEDGGSEWVPGTVAGGSGGGMTALYKSTNYTLTKDDLVYSEAGLTHTLPATPTTGDKCSVWDMSDNAGTSAITVDRNGETIDGVADDFSLNMDGGRVDFMYDGSGWIYSYVVQTIQPDTTVTSIKKKTISIAELEPYNGASKVTSNSGYTPIEALSLPNSGYPQATCIIGLSENWTGKIQNRVIWSPTTTNTSDCDFFTTLEIVSDSGSRTSEVWFGPVTDAGCGTADATQVAGWTGWKTFTQETNAAIYFRVYRPAALDTFTGTAEVLLIEIEYEIEETLTAAVSQTLSPGYNYFINPAFDIWQRGTTDVTGSDYFPDRWYVEKTSGVTRTVSQEAFTVGQTDVPANPKYYLRNVITVAGSTTDSCTFEQDIEDVDTLAGEAVMVSFYAKASSALKIGIQAVQEFGTGGSTAVEGTGIAKTLTTSWAKYTVPMSLASISGKTIGTDSYLAIKFHLSAGSTLDSESGSIGLQTGTIETANFKIEKGSVATEFVPRLEGEELALCQRYFWKWDSSTNAYNTISVGLGEASAVAYCEVSFPVTMRSVPSLEISSAGDFMTYDGATARVATALTLGIAGVSNGLLKAIVSTGVVSGTALTLQADNTLNAYASFDAEF